MVIIQLFMEIAPTYHQPLDKCKDFQNETTVGYSEISEGVTGVIPIHPIGSYSISKDG